MTDHLSDQELQDRLWKEIGHDHLGMLGVQGGEPRHFKPMTPYREEGADPLWFFTRKSVDLVKAAQSGSAQALFVFQAKDGKFQASLAGRLSEDFSEERRDRYWNPAAGAYFPEGKEDPELTLLRLDLEDAEIWHSEAGPVRFVWEVAKANLTHSTPDMGDKAEISF